MELRKFIRFGPVIALAFVLLMLITRETGELNRHLAAIFLVFAAAYVIALLVFWYRLARRKR